MTAKETLVAIYNYLTADDLLLSLMGINSPTPNPKLIQSRINKTRQLGNVADRYPRLAIYEKRPSPQNRRVATHTIVVDAIVPLETQSTTGLALDMAERIKISLDKKPIGMKVRWEATLDDQPTAYGWYKTSVLFTYDKVET